ncbi:MAG TPA: ABC transporter [Chloroflexi bacterium]|nr:ABC transporter [Chloroflexota bacterium]
MNIFKRELKANLKSLVIWSVIVVLFVMVGFSKFSAYYENPELLAILDTMPKAMLEAFSLTAFNLTTITGFFGVMYIYFALLLSIAAAIWGSDIISKEERDKTVEFALTLPVTRSKLITAKALAALFNCIVLALVTWGASIISVASYKPDSEFYSFLNLGMLALFFMQLIFLAIGILLGCAMKQHKRAGSVAVSILLATYLFSIISGLNENLEFLKYFTPFKYFDAASILSKSQLDLGYVLLSAAIVVAAMAGAYLTYAKRDLYI